MLQYMLCGEFVDIEKLYFSGKKKCVLLKSCIFLMNLTTKISLSWTDVMPLCNLIVLLNFITWYSLNTFCFFQLSSLCA